MPLLIVCGYPCCGKTTFSYQLAEYIKKETQNDVYVINEESENISKISGYSSSFAEKGTRASIKSAVNNKLNNNSYVIVDALNYIKGYRYELYCMARSLRTSHCVCWVVTDESLSEFWNKARQELDKDHYDLDM
jgi:protein KTI12